MTINSSDLPPAIATNQTAPAALELLKLHSSNQAAKLASSIDRARSSRGGVGKLAAATAMAWCDRLVSAAWAALPVVERSCRGAGDDDDDDDYDVAPAA